MFKVLTKGGTTIKNVTEGNDLLNHALSRCKGRLEVQIILFNHFLNVLYILNKI